MIIVSGVTISGSTRYFVLKWTKGEKWCPTFVLVAGKQVGLLLLASYPLETVARCPKGQVKHVLWRALQNAVIARHRD